MVQGRVNLSFVSIVERYHDKDIPPKLTPRTRSPTALLAGCGMAEHALRPAKAAASVSPLKYFIWFVCSKRKDERRKLIRFLKPL